MSSQKLSSYGDVWEYAAQKSEEETFVCFIYAKEPKTMLTFNLLP